MFHATRMPTSTDGSQGIQDGSRSSLSRVSFFMWAIWNLLQPFTFIASMKTPCSVRNIRFARCGEYSIKAYKTIVRNKWMTSAAWLNRQGEKAERQDKNVLENLFERQPTRGGKNVHETNENERAKLGLPPSARHHVPPERKQRACIRPASPSETNAHARPCKNMMINKINRGHRYSNQRPRASGPASVTNQAACVLCSGCTRHRI